MLYHQIAVLKAVAEARSLGLPMIVGAEFPNHFRGGAREGVRKTLGGMNSLGAAEDFQIRRFDGRAGLSLRRKAPSDRWGAVGFTGVYPVEDCRQLVTACNWAKAGYRVRRRCVEVSGLLSYAA
jgi:hypothetical protein